MYTNLRIVRGPFDSQLFSGVIRCSSSSSGWEFSIPGLTQTATPEGPPKTDPNLIGQLLNPGDLKSGGRDPVDEFKAHSDNHEVAETYSNFHSQVTLITITLSVSDIIFFDFILDVWQQILSKTFQPVECL